MSSKPTRSAAMEATPGSDGRPVAATPYEQELAANEMPCPVCGEAMPDLKGGKATICPNCGFKDSCCF